MEFGGPDVMVAGGETGLDRSITAVQFGVNLVQPFIRQRDSVLPQPAPLLYPGADGQQPATTVLTDK